MITTDQQFWTIGHSTRPISAFVGLLAASQVAIVADIRRYPGSRRQPQFNPTELSESLQAGGIEYHWIPALGGRRKSSTTGQPTAWKNASFNAYANYIDTPEFADGLNELRMLAAGGRTAMMCAEALWWRCHRRIVADVLVTAGAVVWHINDRGVEPHRLMPPARRVNGQLSYAPDQLTS